MNETFCSYRQASHHSKEEILIMMMMMVKDYDDDGMEITFKRWFGRQGSWSGKTRGCAKINGT